MVFYFQKWAHALSSPALSLFLRTNLAAILFFFRLALLVTYYRMNLYFVSVGNGENNSKKRGNFSLSGKKMQSINFKNDFQPKEEGKLTLRKGSTRFWILFERSTSWMIDFWLVFYRGSLSKYVLKAGFNE